MYRKMISETILRTYWMDSDSCDRLQDFFLILKPVFVRYETIQTFCFYKTELACYRFNSDGDGRSGGGLL